MRKLRSFKNDQRGIFWTVTIGICIILLTTITWGFVMLITTNFVSAFGNITTDANTLYLGSQSIMAGNIVVVVIDVGVAVWMLVTAFKNENQEIPDYMLG